MRRTRSTGAAAANNDLEAASRSSSERELVIGQCYTSKDLLEQLQRSSDGIKPGRILKESNKKNGDLVISCPQRFTTSCKFGVLATEQEDVGVYCLAKVMDQHSPGCLKQAAKARTGRSTQVKKEPKLCNPFDNTSGDEAVPDLELPVYPKYRSSSLESGTSESISTPVNDTIRQASEASEVQEDIAASTPDIRTRDSIGRFQRGSRGIATKRSRQEVSLSKIRSASEDIKLPFQTTPSTKLPSFKKQKVEVKAEEQEPQVFSPDLSGLEQLFASAVPRQPDHVKAFYATNE